MPWNSETEAFKEIEDEQEHETYIYPEDSSRTCTFVTPAGDPNVFGEWAEVTDSGATTLSSKVTSGTHLTAIQIEELEEELIYHLEIAYGADKTNVFRHRFLRSADKRATLIAFMRIRSRVIPVGEMVYYRMMCSAAETTCKVSFRYHCHN